MDPIDDFEPTGDETTWGPIPACCAEGCCPAEPCGCACHADDPEGGSDLVLPPYDTGEHPDLTEYDCDRY